MLLIFQRKLKTKISIPSSHSNVGETMILREISAGEGSVHSLY